MAPTQAMIDEALTRLKAELESPGFVAALTALNDLLEHGTYVCDGCGETFPGEPFTTRRDGEYPRGLRYCEPCIDNEWRMYP